MKPIAVGDRAPALTAVAHNGQQVSLSDYVGKQVVVLYFYPMDGTPVCTAEACAFRDSYQAFTDAGAVVIGVSSDSPDRHRAFATEQKLPFQLLSDADGAIRHAFGVPKTFGLIPGRVTYIIDKQGLVQHVFNSQFSAAQHVSEAMAVVKRLLAGD